MFIQHHGRSGCENVKDGLQAGLFDMARRAAASLLSPGCIGKTNLDRRYQGKSSGYMFVEKTRKRRWPSGPMATRW